MSWIYITGKMPGVGRPVEIMIPGSDTKVSCVLMCCEGTYSFVGESSILVCGVSVWRYTACGSSDVSESSGDDKTR